jgi:hypothetical protein
MAARLLGLVTIVLLTAPQAAVGQGIDCGFYNEISIPDPAGDATPGAPAYVDILGLTIRQFRDRVQFRWRSDGNPYNSDRMYFFIFIDIDNNPSTGAGVAGIGAEIKIGVNVDTYVHRFAANGTWLGDERGLRVVFRDDGFVFDIDREWLGSDLFTVYFEASGQPPWTDYGSIQEIALLATRPGPSVVLTSDRYALEEDPTVVDIPDQLTGVQLHAHLVHDGSSIELGGTQVEYIVFHNSPVIVDAESIISIDENGVAHYNSPGFVFATAEIEECGLQSDVIILATGEVHEPPTGHQIMAIWPADYSPNLVNATYGEIMANYPNFLHTMNVGYQIISDLYNGFRPFGGDTQVLTTVEVNSNCHDGNPLLSPPDCYFYRHGAPSYVYVMHEMGHNFQQTEGMNLLSTHRIAHMGFGECSASLPVIYMFSEITSNGAQYGLGPGTYEWDEFNRWRQMDDSNFDAFDDFEAQISAGEIEGFFDENGDFDGVAMFCCLFQTHVYGHGEYSTPYGHELIRRFFNVFDDEGFEDIQYDEIETYFAAAFSAAAGKNLRDRFHFWGFDIDDAFYDQIMPMIESRIELFSDRFEFGNLNKWSAVNQ